jgi:anaphase-promoting complex subunit 8
MATRGRAEELRRAVDDCRARGLAHAATWACEQLVGLGASARDGASASAVGRGDASMMAMEEYDDDGGVFSVVVDNSGADDIYQLAKSYFDLGEYRRCAYALKDASAPLPTFVREYATFLAGEKSKGQSAGVSDDGGDGKGSSSAGQGGDSATQSIGARRHGAGAGTSTTGNQELESLNEWLRGATNKDGFLTYLHGVVCREMGQPADAKAHLVQACKLYPLNWSAWQALIPMLASEEEERALDLPRSHWVYRWFLGALQLEMQKNKESLDTFIALGAEFPQSKVLLGHMAEAHYNLREFDQAQDIYRDIRELDPYRIDGMDNYSNVLYVKEEFADLSHLAHHLVMTDKYRPETCCIVGNYYSLKSQHAKAVVYFKRALRLNPRYLSAWTLVGHEYVEMKNPAAAIDAYRHAVDINPRDFRAWYGLGQTYEILQMPYYAMYYYQQAVKLRPDDARMWCAMGQCYESDQLKMFTSAIRCYQRAVANNEREGLALSKLATLHANKNEKAAAHYYLLNLKRLDEEGVESGEKIEALEFLSQFYKKEGRLGEAEAACVRLLDVPGPAKHAAKALLREIHSMQSAAK